MREAAVCERNFWKKRLELRAKIREGRWVGQTHSSGPVGLSTLVLQAHRRNCTRNHRGISLCTDSFSSGGTTDKHTARGSCFFSHCCVANDTMWRNFHHTYTQPYKLVKLTTDILYERLCGEKNSHRFEAAVTKL